ncbi:Mbeg1-like protein [Parahaliea mediterranea]|uniref:Mbeg1-like protein n=1 Tax=Parahaliea mediterranea TaxID=651086 RepID=UPI000E2E5337|nr:Mbeg1-like protein [Parahaliea mediterranea]
MIFKKLCQASSIFLFILASGCASIRGTGLSILPKNWGNEEGYIWCNARYLDINAYKESGSAKPESDLKLALARKGYIYALAAGLTLQKSGESEDKHFFAPDSLRRIDTLNVDDRKSGFQASTFEYYGSGDRFSSPKIIIAFRGSDEFYPDYLKHNFALWWEPVQFKPAREYVKKVAKTYPSNDLIATGFSLGGGLAIHVLQSKPTSSLITQAWAFNPSHRTGVKKSPSDRLYLAAVEGEILELFRTDGLGAIEGHYSNEYGLINSSSIYGHSRWVLIRQMLYYADLVEFEESGRTKNRTEPLDIIMASNVPNGCTEKIRRELANHGRIAKTQTSSHSI